MGKQNRVIMIFKTLVKETNIPTLKGTTAIGRTEMERTQNPERTQNVDLKRSKRTLTKRCAKMFCSVVVYIQSFPISKVINANCFYFAFNIEHLCLWNAFSRPRENMWPATASSVHDHGLASMY